MAVRYRRWFAGGAAAGGALAQTGPGALFPNGIVTCGYSYPFTASGGDGERTWSLLSGTLPKGLQLDSRGGLEVKDGQVIGNGSSAQLVTGVYTFTIRVTDAAAAVSDKEYTLTVDPLNLTSSFPAGGVSQGWGPLFQFVPMLDFGGGQLTNVLAYQIPQYLKISSANRALIGATAPLTAPVANFWVTAMYGDAASTSFVPASVSQTPSLSQSAQLVVFSDTSAPGDANRYGPCIFGVPRNTVTVPNGWWGAAAIIALDSAEIIVLANGNGGVVTLDTISVPGLAANDVIKIDGLKNPGTGGIDIDVYRNAALIGSYTPAAGVVRTGLYPGILVQSIGATAQTLIGSFTGQLK